MSLPQMLYPTPDPSGENWESVGLKPSSGMMQGPIHRTADIGAAESDLRRLQKSGLTTAGRKWFEVACDPYHDRAVDCEGYPDYDETNTIVSVVRRRLAVVKNPNIQTNYDVNIYSTGLHMTEDTSAGVQIAGMTYTRPTNADIGEIGTLVVAQSPTGTPTFSTTSTIRVPLAPNQALSPVKQGGTDHFCDGAHRIIAAGFEVVATGPPIFLGGDLTCYRQNPGATDLVLARYGTSSGAAPQSYDNSVILKGPPSEIEDVMLLPDTRTWPMFEGAYVTLVQNGCENPLIQPKGQNVFLQTQQGQQDNEPPIIAEGPNRLGGFGSTAIHPRPRSYTCFAQSGVYMTNLNPEVTLTINLVSVIERAPAVSEADLLVLAKPSPTEDRIAFMLYSEAMREMPPGVKLSENALGGWFRSVVGKVARTVAPQVPRMLSAAKPLAAVALDLASNSPNPKVRAAASLVKSEEVKELSSGLSKAARKRLRKMQAQ